MTIFATVNVGDGFLGGHRRGGRHTAVTFGRFFGGDDFGVSGKPKHGGNAIQR